MIGMFKRRRANRKKLSRKGIGKETRQNKEERRKD
jgi:hypothetical protein